MLTVILSIIIPTSLFLTFLFIWTRGHPARAVEPRRADANPPLGGEQCPKRPKRHSTENERKKQRTEGEEEIQDHDGNEENEQFKPPLDHYPSLVRPFDFSSPPSIPDSGNKGMYMSLLPESCLLGVLTLMYWSFGSCYPA